MLSSHIGQIVFLAAVIINIILFLLKVQPNTTYKLFARKKKQTEVHKKRSIVNRYEES